VKLDGIRVQVHRSGDEVAVFTRSLDDITARLPDVVAAVRPLPAREWGHGRRKGWLSNLHLGARDPRTGGFVMLGKTFKGLTDELLRWQTERFKQLAVEDNGWVVTVRPEQVVEIAFDGVQTSPRYPGGVALRFARVLRYRDDKRAGEADTIDMVKSLGPVL